MNIHHHFPSPRWVWALLLVTAVLGQPAHAERASIVGLDRIVAVVNDDVILGSELDKKIDAVRARIRDSGSSPPPPELLQKEVLDRLVLQRLQLQKADEMGIRVSEERLNQAISSIADQNKLSLEEFRKILVDDGFDFGEFRQSIREELLIAQVKKQLVERRVQISDREIDEKLATMARQGGGAQDEYRVGHILISVPADADPDQRRQARDRAETIRKKLVEGADFESVARAESEGRQAEQGGDLGWRKLDELPRLFTNTVSSMGVGDISEVLSSSSGFHIVSVLDAKYQGQHLVRQTHARHILIRTDELTGAETAKTRLLQLKQRIESGDDFFELARSHSDDTSSSIKGGDLGWTNPGDFVPAFERAMDQLAVNEISEPFESPFGWHIVQVLGRRNHDNTELVRRNEAREELMKQKLEEETQAWLRELREEAYVQYRLDAE